jgi:hypothetical protein
MHGAVHTVASLQGYRQQRQSTICSHRQPVGVIARCAWSSVGRLLHQQTAQLQQQKRMAQHRFQEDYLEHLRQQQVFLQNDRHPDYDRDPYFYTAPIYRYNRATTRRINTVQIISAKPLTTVTRKAFGPDPRAPCRYHIRILRVRDHRKPCDVQCRAWL